MGILLLRNYLEVNILLASACLVCLGLAVLFTGPRRHLRPTQLLWICYASLIASLVLPLLFLLFPVSSITPPAVQVWSAPQHVLSIDQASATLPPSSILGSQPTTVPLLAFKLFGAIAALGLALGLFRVGRDYLSLYRQTQQSFLLRRVGRVFVVAIDSITTPFSYRTLSRAYVAVPIEFPQDQHRFRVAVLHELQHHRQGDTLWIHLLGLMRLLFFINPLFRKLEKEISTIQELACDENLVDRKKVSVHAYGSCLLWAAENSLNTHRPLAGTAGMAMSVSGKTLRRRIDMMSSYEKHSQHPLNWGVGALCGTIALATLLTTAFASQGLIKDRRVTMEDAKRLAFIGSNNSEFPVVVNEAVLEQLNRYIGTPDGRTYMRDALTRMATYRPMIEKKIGAYNVPIELLAIPIVESGFKNISGRRAVGIWQFIPESARNFGLRVDEHRDERLNEELETDAGLRYLLSNRLRFQDWQLAVLAYNSGENHVQRGIDATGSRDAWKLIHSGFENDKSYLAKVMAAIIILKNPSTVN